MDILSFLNIDAILWVSSSRLESKQLCNNASMHPALTPGNHQIAILFRLESPRVRVETVSKIRRIIRLHRVRPQISHFMNLPWSLWLLCPTELCFGIGPWVASDESILPRWISSEHVSLKNLAMLHLCEDHHRVAHLWGPTTSIPILVFLLE